MFFLYFFKTIIITACSDYHPDCARWATSGECNKNGWMLENCRLSCDTCLNGYELRQMCRGARRKQFSSDNVPPFEFGRRRKRVIQTITGAQSETDIQLIDNHFSFASLESWGMPTF